jgi:hypothetical protein
MKFMIPFLIAILPVASLAQSQSGVASGVPSVDGDAAAREGTVDGSRVYSSRTFDAAAGIVGSRSAAVTGRSSQPKEKGRLMRLIKIAAAVLFGFPSRPVVSKQPGGRDQ